MSTQMHIYLTKIINTYFLLLLINGVSSLTNVDNIRKYVATDMIQAEDYTSASDFQTFDDCADVIYQGQLSATTVLEYDQVDFGYGVQVVTLRASNTYAGGEALNVSLHTGSSTSSAFALIQLNFTGNDRCSFVNVEFSFYAVVVGIQNLFVTFPSGMSGYINLDWLVFNKTAVKFVATETIEMEDYSYQSGCNTDNSCYGLNLSYVYPGSSSASLRFDQVDFGSSGLQGGALRAAIYYSDSATVVLSLGSPTAPPIATLRLTGNTYSDCNFTTLNFTLDAPVSGVQYLFVSISSYAGSSFKLDWITFGQLDYRFEATEKVEAENYTSGKNIKLFDDCTDVRYVGLINSSSLLEFDQVDFGASGVEMVILRVSSFYTGPPLDISLRLGNSSSTPFVTLPIGQTGNDACDFLVIDAFLDPKPIGVQNMFVTFPSAVGGYLRLDWLQFKRTNNL